LGALTQDAVIENLKGTILKRLQALVRESVDHHAICEHAVKGSIQVLNLCGCYLHMFNAESTLVIARYEYVCDRDDERSILVQHVGYPDGDPPDTNPIVESSEFTDAEGIVIQTLRYPLISQMEVLGEMVIQRIASEPFDNAVRDWIEQVATYCAIGVRQMRFLRVSQTQAVELKRLNQLQDNFLSTVSYELRIPLSNIKMSIQMLSLALRRSSVSEASDSPELHLNAPAYSKVSRYLEVLQKECDRETKLIQDLLDLQQLDNDTISLLISAIDVEQWLSYVVNPFQKRFQEYSLNYEIDIEPDLPALMCDQISLSRIMVELLNNAYRYTPGGENIHIRTFQKKGPGNRGNFLHLEVVNTGVEIPTEERSRVFNKFYRIPRLDIRKQGGTGLGLALVQKLVTRLGGEIQLTGGSGNTTFTVVLPFQGVRS
jgi:signal transduction histidine kinase